MIVSVPKAIEILQSEEICALPTETVYGLAASIHSESALKKIFETKKRPFFDPLIVHVAHSSQVPELVREWPKVYETLVKAFWPGPLTLIAPKSQKVSDLITSGLDTVALRAPNHPLALQILRELKTPLAAPSANRFGKTSPTTAVHVEAEFDGQVPVVDGGACDVGVESTVLRASFEIETWRLEILRPGGISREKIADALKAKDVKFEFVSVKNKEASPGTLEHHYQPDSPVILLNAPMKEDSLRAKLKEKSLLEIEDLRIMHLPATPEVAARVLYSELRYLSKPRTAIVFEIEKQHREPAWETVLDRLQRASTYRF